MNLSTYLDSLKKRWTLLSQATAFIVVVIAGFVTPPEVYDPASGFKTAKALAVFIVVILAGLSFYLSRRWSRKRDAFKWLISTSLFLSLCVAGYLFSERLKDERTCQYPGEVKVIGTAYTQHGRDYVSQNPGISCEALLMDHGGKAELVWDPNSISNSRIILLAAYLVSFMLAAVCIVSVTQLVTCVTNPK